MTRKTKITLIITAVIMSLIILSIVALFVIMIANNSPEDFEKKILPELEKNIDGQISYSEVDLKVFPIQEISIKEFEIKAEKDYEKIHITDLKLGLSFLELLFGKIKITRIEAVGGVIPVVRTYDGKITVGGSIPKTGSSFNDIDYEGKINLRDVKLSVEGVGKEKIIFENANLNSSVELNKDDPSSFFGKLTFKELMLDNGKDPSPFSGLEGSIDINARYFPDRKQLEVSDSKITLNDEKLDFSMVISDVMEKQPHLALSLKAEGLDLEKVLEIISKKRFGVMKRISVKGKADLDFSLKGRVPAYEDMVDMQTDGFMKIYDTEISAKGGSGGKGKLMGINMDGVFNGSSLTFKKLECRTESGNLSGNFRITDLTKFDLILNLTGNFDAGVVASIFGAKEGWEVKGKGRGDVRIEGVPDDISHLDIEGEFRELEGEFNLSIFKEPIVVKNGKLRVEGNSINAENFIMMVGEDRLKLEGEMQGFKYPQIEYSVKGEMLNLEENLVDGLGRGKGSKPDEYTTSLKGEYDIGTVKLWGITAKDFKAQTVYKDGIVKFDRLQFRAYGGKVDGTASILIPERSYTFSIMADDIDIGRYLTDNTDYKDVVVGGRLNVDIMFSGKGITKDDAKEYLRGEGIVVFRDGLITKLTVLNRLAGWSHITVLKDIFVKRIDAGFVIGDGGIFIRDLEITSKDIKKGFLKGKVNFDETLDIYGEIRLTRDATEKFKERAITLSLDKDGCGAFAFHLTGKTTAPSYQLDVERTGQLAEDNVGGLSVFEKEYFGN